MIANSTALNLKQSDISKEATPEGVNDEYWNNLEQLTFYGDETLLKKYERVLDIVRDNSHLKKLVLNSNPSK